MDQDAEALARQPLRRKVRITNPQGFHMRPMRAFVELAMKFRSEISVQRDEAEPLDGKSMMSLMLLVAEPGTELTVEAEGPDALDAVAALADLLANLETRVELDLPD
jgi:phosphocarrier protein HPr